MPWKLHYNCPDKKSDVQTSTQFLKRSISLLVRKKNGERTLSKLWAHAERNLVNVYEQLANAERKMNGEHTVNDLYTLCELKISYLFGVPWKLYPHCISSVIRKNKNKTKITYMNCYQPKYKIMLVVMSFKIWHINCTYWPPVYLQITYDSTGDLHLIKIIRHNKILEDNSFGVM